MHGKAFHARVDGRGPAVVLARTQKGAVIGGFNPKGWVGLGEYRGSLGAFLFAWPDGDTRAPALKLRKVGGSGLAVIDEAGSGPRFGADGLDILLTNRAARCKLGPYYERRRDGGNSIFAEGEGNQAALTSVQVFVGVYGEGEEVPFSGPDSGIQGIG
jgi:hypothetical protein